MSVITRLQCTCIRFGFVSFVVCVAHCPLAAYLLRFRSSVHVCDIGVLRVSSTFEPTVTTFFTPVQLTVISPMEDFFECLPLGTTLVVLVSACQTVAPGSWQHLLLVFSLVSSIYVQPVSVSGCLAVNI